MLPSAEAVAAVPSVSLGWRVSEPTPLVPRRLSAAAESMGVKITTMRAMARQSEERMFALVERVDLRFTVEFKEVNRRFIVLATHQRVQIF